MLPAQHRRYICQASRSRSACPYSLPHRRLPPCAVQSHLSRVLPYRRESRHGAYHIRRVPSGRTSWRPDSRCSSRQSRSWPAYAESGNARILSAWPRSPHGSVQRTVRKSVPPPLPPRRWKYCESREPEPSVQSFPPGYPSCRAIRQSRAAGYPKRRRSGL